VNWLITGGCGFIGAALIQKIASDTQHNIRVLDNLTIGSREDLRSVCNYVECSVEKLNDSPSGIELIVGDILDDNLAVQLAKNIDVIVHLAANTGVGPSVENPRSDCMSNVIGTFNYLEAARVNNVPRFIFASSGAPAGEVEPPIHEELPPHPVSPYGASKLAGEGYCSAYYRTFGVQTVALRFGNVYGPGSSKKSSVVAKFIRNALVGKTLEIFGDGTQTRDFIYIDDLVRAVLLASMRDEIGGETFQIATNMETTVGEMTDMLVAILGQRNVQNIQVVNAETRLGDVKRNFSDTSKAREMLGWEPEASLEQGLVRTVDYFLKGISDR